MGSRGKIEPSNIKMRAVLMSLAGLFLVAPQTEGTMKLMEKMVNEVNTHRLKSDCFGEANKKAYDLAIEGAMEKCMQLAPAFNLLNMPPRSRDSTSRPLPWPRTQSGGRDLSPATRTATTSPSPSPSPPSTNTRSRRCSDDR